MVSGSRSFDDVFVHSTSAAKAGRVFRNSEKAYIRAFFSFNSSYIPGDI